MKMKPYVISVIIIISFILVLPAAIVLPYSGGQQAAQPAKQPQQPKAQPDTTSSQSALTVSVYRSEESKVESLPLQEYLIGVVASEMPAEFELEALKAQAVAARTYLVNYLLNGSKIDIPGGAEVTDTVNHQVYHDDKELKQIWGINYDWKMAKITKAVQQTAGQILTYNKKPITASFFSTSNGYTENSGAYWSKELPYLKSVPSPWDLQSPKFTYKETIPLQTVEQKLGVNITNGGEIGRVLKTTPGNRVGLVEIGGKKIEGRKVRQELGLRSTDFTMEVQGNEVVVRTKGYGHGVGMSQYGANGMAKEGKSYKDIVSYYYQGVSISNIQSYTSKLTAKK